MNYTLDEITQAAEWLLQQIGDSRVLAFYGQMGAGKTTLIRALCDVLGTDDVVTSPTFALVNEYSTRNSQIPTVYHFDFYRIRQLSEADDIGLDEYFYSGHLCLIEWPEMIEERLPDDAVSVRISEAADGSRMLTIN